MTPGAIGPEGEPFAGRAWLRRFPHGEVEFLYKSGRGPSELERLNSWMADAGIENRVTRLSPFCGAPRPKHETTPEDNAARTLRRAKQRIRWSAKAIGCDQMLTLTYREEVTEFAETRKHLARFVAMCRKEWPTFRYVSTPEIQPERLARTGVAVWHWHMGVRGFVNYDKLRGFWWRAMGERVQWSTEGKPILRDRHDSPGNVQGVAARSRGRTRRGWSSDKLGAYLSKYLAKSLGNPDVEGHSYSVSRGLEWVTERYAIRGFTYSAVSGAMFSLLGSVGVLGPHIWQSEDRAVLWAAGRSQGSLDPPNAL